MSRGREAARREEQLDQEQLDQEQRNQEQPDDQEQRNQEQPDDQEQREEQRVRRTNRRAGKSVQDGSRGKIRRGSRPGCPSPGVLARGGLHFVLVPKHHLCAEGGSCGPGGPREAPQPRQFSRAEFFAALRRRSEPQAEATSGR